jgi:DNA-binding HxlR family transcriptional regulator
MLDAETVMLVTLSYIIGIVSVIIFNRLKAQNVLSEPKAGYERSMREYENMLVDLRIRLDALEIRTGDALMATSRPESQPTAQAGDINHMPAQVQNAKPVIRRALEQEGAGLVDYVLRLLVEGPKTSRQIEALIGRSREHTARLLKKMFEMGYVARDMSAKPYTYSITESGRKVVQVASTASA